MPTSTPYVFDAAAVLGLGTPSTDPLPRPEEGRIVLRVPPGLTLRALRDSRAGQLLMSPQNDQLTKPPPPGVPLVHSWGWYDRYGWSGVAPPAGHYRLRIPVPGSRNRTFSRMLALLQPGEQVAPVALAAAALLCIRRKGGRNPLGIFAAYCCEATEFGQCRVLWEGGRLVIDSDEGANKDRVSYLASVRQILP